MSGKIKKLRLLLKKDGELIECRENVLAFLTQHPDWDGVLGYNEFSGRVMKLKPPPFASAPGEWTQEDDFNLGLWMAYENGLIVKSDAFIVSAVAMAAYRNKYHPIKQWLESLPPWDKTDRLGHFLADCTGCKQSEYSALVGTLFMVGMVARIYRPGCSMQYMPILEGSQGVGKSSFWRALAGEWFQDTPFKIGDKDAYMQLQGVWLYEIAELDSLNKADATSVKAFITQNNDRFREPYGRRIADWPRQCLFVGTTNHYEYLRDATGNRRFWPISARSMNIEALRNMRDQLYAQALALYHAGRRWHPTAAQEGQFFVPQQERRRVIDAWLYLIQDWLSDIDQQMVNEFTVLDILRGAVKVHPERIDNFNAMSQRVSRLMQELGWERRRRTSGGRQWVYLRPKDQQIKSK